MVDMPKIPKHKKLTISPRRIHFGNEQRRGEILRSEAAGVQLQTVAGRTLVAGDGQALIPISFPVTFTEQPALSFGAAVDDNQGHGANNVATSFPQVTVIVMDWVREERLTGIFLYRGANVAATLSGSPGYVWVHWQAMGKAYRNPAKGVGSTSGAA